MTETPSKSTIKDKLKTTALVLSILSTIGTGSSVWTFWSKYNVEVQFSQGLLKTFVVYSDQLDICRGDN